jgi:hypothetical protein
MDRVFSMQELTQGRFHLQCEQWSSVADPNPGSGASLTVDPRSRFGIRDGRNIRIRDLG